MLRDQRHGLHIDAGQPGELQDGDVLSACGCGEEDEMVEDAIDSSGECGECVG